MRSALSFSLLLAALSSLPAHAHFQLQYPPPRGVFVENAEPGFCDGYTNPTGPRTHFPLTGGVFSWNSEHPQWTSAFYISTTNASSFNDFQQVNSFFNAEGEGVVCVPLDLKSSNATGLTNGQNVTVQILFNGGDGSLFQCADLVLDDSAQQGVLGAPCVKNITTTSAPAKPTNTGGAMGVRVGAFGGLGVGLNAGVGVVVLGVVGGLLGMGMVL